MRNATAQTRCMTKAQFRRTYGVMRKLSKARNEFDFDSQESAELELEAIKAEIGKVYSSCIRCVVLTIENRQ